MSTEKDKTITERSEILFVYEAKDCNPNGDPMDENKPRTDPEIGVATVTDVRIKRWIRDYWYDRLGLEILIRDTFTDEGFLKDGKGRAEDFVADSKVDRKKDTIGQIENKVREQVLRTCIDARVFGCTLPVKGKEKQDGSVTLTGPAQFSGFNRSLHRVEPQRVQGTAAFASTETAMQKSFRQDHILPYACIAAYGIVNELAARTTGMSQDDRKLLLEGLWLGCKDLISRSKIGHQPLLLVHILYKDGYRIGDLAGRIREDQLVREERDGRPIEETKLRGTEDYKLNLAGLLKAMSKKKERISTVEIKYDPQLRLWCEGDVPDLKKHLEKMGLTVVELDLEVPSKSLKAGN